MILIHIGWAVLGSVKPGNPKKHFPRDTGFRGEANDVPEWGKSVFCVVEAGFHFGFCLFFPSSPLKGT